MKIKSNKIKKQIYFQPHIERIMLDMEISLVLESLPPAGPGETFIFLPETHNSDPFKTQIS